MHLSKIKASHRKLSTQKHKYAFVFFSLTQCFFFKRLLQVPEFSLFAMITWMVWKQRQQKGIWNCGYFCRQFLQDISYPAAQRSGNIHINQIWLSKHNVPQSHKTRFLPHFHWAWLFIVSSLLHQNKFWHAAVCCAHVLCLLRCPRVAPCLQWDKTFIATDSDIEHQNTKSVLQP